MTQTISFGNIILANNGKRGILKPCDDGSGYYPLNAGGFNIPNRGGINYRANDYIRDCMGPDSDLNRRIARGEVYCELGHPPRYYMEKINGQVVRRQITDVYEWIMRLKTIDMDRVCAHIRKIHWDMTGGINDPIYNRIELKPFGPFACWAEQGLTDPDVNFGVSIRTVTKPQRFGDRVREVEHFSGYDAVVEGGMNHANKHMTAGLEDLFSSGFLSTEGNEIVTDVDAVISLCEKELTNPKTMERFAGTESLNEVRGMLDDIKRLHKPNEPVRIISDASSLFR